MKKFITILAGCAVAIGVMAADELTSFSVTSTGVGTNVVTVAQKYNGFVDSVYVKVPSATTTSTVYMASALTKETIVSNSVTASAVIRPRVAVQTTTNTAIGTVTNVCERIKLVEEGITLKLAEANAATNTYIIYLKLSDK